MIFENIPIELKNLPRWVCWRDINKRKIPFDAKTLNGKASSTNSDTWATYEEALLAYEERSDQPDAFTGIGIVLNGDGLNGVDIDHCFHDGKPLPEALSLLEHLGAAYIEISPSGTGLRAFGYAPPLNQGCKGTWDGLSIELYSTERYLTLTGNAIKNEGALRDFNGFESLAYAIRVDKRVDKITGEISEIPQDERHAELIKRIITGEVYHDSLRDMAYSLIGGGLHPGSVVNHLRALMDMSTAPHDDRWSARRRQISDLVNSARRKLDLPDPFDVSFLKEDEDLLDAMGGIYADQLSDTYEPPDELIQDLLVNRTISILYGDSNSGKTFFAIDMACHIASGRIWFGKQVEEGLVVYLATESPETVKARIQAHQKYHDKRIPNLLIIQVAVNFHESDYDVNRIITLVKQEEQMRNVKCKLIIGDTLARISAGANENSGTDMGPIMARFDHIMNSVSSAVLIVHHCGKDAAKGGRGWSGIRAHIDTEIEVSEKDNIKCATITKQRALSSKGEEFYFELEILNMGKTKFGADATTCVVKPLDDENKPKKTDSKLAKNMKTFVNAWLESGLDVINDYPYLSKEDLTVYLERMGWAKQTIKNHLVASNTDKLIGFLLNGAIIEPYKAGWIVVNELEKTFMLLQKDD